MAAEGERSLEETPTWAFSVFCSVLLLISFSIEGGLHKLTQFLRRRKRKSLNQALAKIKTEMMKFGFISFLLAISEVPISKICINKDLTNSFLPCNEPLDYLTQPASASVTQNSDQISYCEAKEGKVALVSGEGILHLNVFISVLAVFHILFCILTMCLGLAKMRRWKRWEDETHTFDYQIANDPRRFHFAGQTIFGKRHLKFWSEYPPLLWMVCFLRQFYNSVSKPDYFTLRNGFIAANVSAGSSFNFQRFLSRAYDEDFERIVGIRFWIWIFSIFFIFLNAHVFYNHYWLPFIPLVVALVVGTKLQVIITKMCVESCKETPVVKGSLLVKPNNDYFWFGRPDWLLILIQFILIQNSFQLAFFSWTWYEYGLRSCFNRKEEDFAIRIAMGIGVQLLCGYVTLPLHALVTQMGSSMRRAVFTEKVVEGLKNWHKKAKKSLSENNSTKSRHSFSLHSKHNSTSSKHSASLHSKAADNSASGIVDSINLPSDEYLPLPLLAATSSPSSTSTYGSGGEEEKGNQNWKQEITSDSTSEITSVEEDPKIITREIYDGDISFSSSWKKIGNSREIS